MSVHVIVNPSARRLREGGRTRRALLQAAAQGHATVHTATSLEALDRIAGEIASRRADAVVLAGGDGSHMAALTALARAYDGALPPVGLAPCGTVSTIAKNFGARHEPEWTARLVAAVCSGAARLEPKATLRVRDDTGGERVGFIFGAGLVARFFDQYYAGPRQGRAAAATIAARAFAGSFFGSALARRILEPARGRVAVDGRAQGGGDRWTLLLASVVRDVGLHFHATYRAGETLDAFHAVGSGLPARELGPQMPRVLAGMPLRGEPRIDALARTLELRFDGAPDSYVLDGDVFSSRSVEVALGPRLSLLVP